MSDQVAVNVEREPMREAYDRHTAQLRQEPQPVTLGYMLRTLEQLREAGVPDDATVSGFGSGFVWASWNREVWQSPRTLERVRHG